MSIVVFSDVHGNLPALEMMLDDAGPSDQYVCLGDVVNYGPWSRDCVELVTSLSNCIYLAGNHEHMFTSNRFEGGHPLAEKFFDFCAPKFDRLDLIDNLPEEHFLHDYLFTHTLEDRDIYPDSEIDIKQNVFIGHSHYQFHRVIDSFHLYNVGSVGQNRKYINVINYAILHPDTRRVDLKSLVYDERLVITEMQRRDYPAECIDYYERKPRLA